MTMQVVPLQPAASQRLTIQLGQQTCQISVYQKSTGLYLNLSINNRLIIAGVLCLSAVGIVRDAYLGFTGELAFYDTQGAADPDYTGLGGRYFLAYLT